MPTDPSFQPRTVAIVGVGLIGGSLAMALKRRRVAESVIGISRDETLTAARELGVIDNGYPYAAVAEGVARAELVVLCTPISRILDLLPDVLAAASPGTVVSDVGSTKREIVARAESLKRDGVHFIGGHPMAGSERSGVAASDPFLFENAIYVLTPAAGVPDDVCRDFADLVRRLGARPMQMDPESHDRTAAAVSHLPQLMATALVNEVGRLHESEGLPLKMAAGGFRDMTRIASSPYDMWRDICCTNSGPIREMIDRYIDRLSSLRDKVGDEGLGDDFAFANRIRSGIPKDSKGFLHPLHEVLLVVEDRPGVIADVASTLGEAGINIDDIEVLKVREGEGGTIRMGFDTREIAERAIEILSDSGRQVRMR